MTTWILVVFVYAGVMSNGDNVALQSIPGFTSKAECTQQGKKAEALVSATMKSYKFVCLEQGGKQ